MRKHEGDGWGRGSYQIPEEAVMGSSVTGDWADSPCKPADVQKEMDGFCTFLKEQGITSHYAATETANLFVQKVWVLVPKKDFEKATELAKQYLQDHDEELHHLHDAKD